MLAAENAPSLPPDHDDRMQRVKLSLAGLSVGDAFGQFFFWQVDAIPLRQLPPPRWHFTDDTVMAESLVETLHRFGTVEQDDLARRFGDRYAEDPARGYGGTAHEILRRIHRGEPWREVAASVFDGQGSMGNGAAMRVAPLGAYFADDLNRCVVEAAKSARVTHTHAEGVAGAIAIAVAAAVAWRCRGQSLEDARAELLQAAYELTPDGPTRTGIAEARDLPLDASVQLAVARLGNGSRVIAIDTVPFCLWCAARHLGNYPEAMWQTVSGLGDRDTTCAIVGGIVALSATEKSIPDAWLASREPLTVSYRDR
jgi:ADP-ribosylglycohydrolase